MVRLAKLQFPLFPFNILRRALPSYSSGSPNSTSFLCLHTRKSVSWFKFSSSPLPLFCFYHNTIHSFIQSFDSFVQPANINPQHLLLVPISSNMPVFASPAYMTSVARNVPNGQTNNFRSFFECWIVEQDRFLQELISVSRSHSDPSREDEQRVICPLANRVVRHYEGYYRAKSRYTKLDVLAMLSPSWTSSLEDAFLWIGGWRPSMAFHLLYSKSGLQLQAKLNELIGGLHTGDLGDLSPNQMMQVDELQSKTIREEKEITEKMAKQQETVADNSMVELSDIVTEMIRNGEVERNGRAEEEQVDSALASKVDGLQKIVEGADELRLKTLKGVIDIFSPIQAVHFLIAAAELHLRLHEWGMKRDAGHHV